MLVINITQCNYFLKKLLPMKETIEEYKFLYQKYKRLINIMLP